MITDPVVSISQPRKRVPMLFKVLQVNRLANADVEKFFPALKVLSDDLNQKLDKMLLSTERQNTVVVRAVWVSEANLSSIQMFCEHVNRPQYAFVQSLRCTTEEFIRYSFFYSSLNRLAEKIDSHFNAQPELYPNQRLICISRGSQEETDSVLNNATLNELYPSLVVLVITLVVMLMKCDYIIVMALQ